MLHLGNPGDTIIFDGIAWDKIDGVTNEVIQVAGLYGNISASSLKSALAIVASDVSGLATVATSGSYADLSSKPTIPAAQVNSDWNATSGTAQILNKPTLATVATSGAYSSLSGTPTLGTAAALNVAVSGNASSGQVVQGSDTRLSWTDNFTAGAELNPNPSFATNLTGWTAVSSTWNTGGGVVIAAGGSMTLNTGNQLAANSIYHCHAVVSVNAGAKLAFALGTPPGIAFDTVLGAGTFDFYWLSPGATSNEELQITNYSSTLNVTITSLSLKPVAFTQKSLLGGLSLAQGGQLVLPNGTQTLPSLTFNDANGLKPGIIWDETQQGFAMCTNGNYGMSFWQDPNYPQINGNGANRLTINNPNALVLQPLNGHMEWEGSNSNFSWAGNDFEVVGYAPGSSIGHGIRFRGEASSGNNPPYILGVHSGQSVSDTLPGLIMIDHTGTIRGTWYPNGTLNAPNVVYNNATVNLTAGYTATANALGSVSSGTITVNPALGDYCTITNNGAFTLAPPTLTSPANCASGVVEIYNGSTPGAITTSAWTKVNNASAFNTTAGSCWQCDYVVTPHGSYLNVREII